MNGQPVHMRGPAAAPLPFPFQQAHYPPYGAQQMQANYDNPSKGFSIAPVPDPRSPISPPPSAKRFSQPPPPPLERRGPPRKPKRSGYAIWVGNIPMYASIEALKDHFSRDATSEIESVFLMSKSSCAFVNYKTKEACDAAVERCNHSLFGPVRLLCRPRRDPDARPPKSEQPSSTHTDSDSGIDVDESNERLEAVSDVVGSMSINDEDREIDTTDVKSTSSKQQSPIPQEPHNRFFVLKSLTKEDLQESLQTGVWETQVHNEKLLDNAFRQADNVYLMFSVNKSGEYFGYARMLSSPLEPTTKAPFEQSTAVHDTDNLRITPTPATETAPRGHIFNDPARGILFWEASEMNGIVSSTPRARMHDEVKNKPFRIEWLSVRKVPFQRTRGMRNSWNGNKEVKVARDGTELETGTGRRIVRLFEESVEERREGS